MFKLAFGVSNDLILKGLFETDESSYLKSSRWVTVGCPSKIFINFILFMPSFYPLTIYLSSFDPLLSLFSSLLVVTLTPFFQFIYQYLFTYIIVPCKWNHHVLDISVSTISHLQI